MMHNALILYELDYVQILTSYQFRLLLKALHMQRNRGT